MWHWKIAVKKIFAALAFSFLRPLTMQKGFPFDFDGVVFLLRYFLQEEDYQVSPSIKDLYTILELKYELIIMLEYYNRS